MFFTPIHFTFGRNEDSNRGQINVRHIKKVEKENLNYSLCLKCQIILQ